MAITPERAQPTYELEARTPRAGWVQRGIIFDIANNFLPRGFLPRGFGQDPRCLNLVMFCFQATREDSPPSMGHRQNGARNPTHPEHSIVILRHVLWEFKSILASSRVFGKSAAINNVIRLDLGLVAFISPAAWPDQTQRELIIYILGRLRVPTVLAHSRHAADP